MRSFSHLMEPSHRVFFISLNDGQVAKLVKAVDCNPTYRRFDSALALQYADMVELADTWDLKSYAPCGRTGSTPVIRTKSYLCPLAKR